MSDTPVTGHLEEIPEGFDYWDAAGGVQVSEDIQARLLRLVDDEVATEQLVADLQVQLVEAQEKLTGIKREKLPELLNEMGVTETKLADGRKVSVTKKAIGTVRKEDEEQWFGWLETTDNDGIIKTKVVAEFGRGEMEEARAAQEALREKGVFAGLDRSIHYQTQQAFVREQLEKGTELPPCLNLSEFSEAKVTIPKVRAKKSK